MNKRKNRAMLLVEDKLNTEKPNAKPDSSPPQTGRFIGGPPHLEA